MSSGSAPSPFDDVLVFLVALGAVYTAICLFRCFLKQMAARHMARSLSDKPPRVRLDSDIIAALPTFTYKKSSDNSVKDAFNNTSSMDCSICLSAVNEGDVVKLLPRCKHSFHATCVDLWLKDHSTCPICRLEILESEAVSNPQSQIEMEERDLERQS